MSKISVTCLREAASGKIWELEQGRALSVGRNEGNDWVFPSRSVSRQHAILDWAGDAPRATVRDLGSANGTRVDGIGLVPHEPVPLTHKSVLEFGELSFEVLLFTRQMEADAKPQATSGRFVKLVSNGRKALAGVVRGWSELEDFLLRLESIKATGVLSVRLPHREVKLQLLKGSLLSPRGAVSPVPSLLREWTEVVSCRFESAPQVEVEAACLDATPTAPSKLFGSADHATRRLKRPAPQVGEETEITRVDPD